MKVKKKETEKITLPIDYFEDNKEYWIETSEWTNYQKNLWGFLFVKEGLTQKDIEAQNIVLDTSKIAKKDFYFVAISILDTNLWSSWKNLSIDERVDLLIWLDTQNTELFQFILESVKKVVKIEV